MTGKERKDGGEKKLRIFWPGVKVSRVARKVGMNTCRSRCEPRVGSKREWLVRSTDTDKRLRNK